MIDLSSASREKHPRNPRRSLGVRIGAAGLVTLAGLALVRGSARAEILLQAPAKAPAAAADEETLLREACNYLQLTRAQVSQLLLVARGTNRRLRTFLKEETDRRPDDVSTPEAKAAAEAGREKRKSQVADEITQHAAPLMTRILSREQIALAWRLMGGNPPKYARANPALLAPAARFTTRMRTIALGLAVELDLQVAELMLRNEELRGAVNPEDLDAAMANAARRQRSQRSIAGVEVTPTGQPDRSKGPFPQRVIESTDLAELVPAVEPLARRLFNSEKWLTELEDRLIAGPFFERGIGAQRRPPLGTLVRVRDYQLGRGFEDQAGRGPDLQPLGGVTQNGSYVFGPGEGLRLGNAGVTDHYAVQFTFRAGASDNYQKLIDFKDGTSDSGLYLYKGQVTFYQLAEGGAPQPGAEHRLRIERNRHTRIVRGYLDFRPIFAFIDLDDAAVFDKSKGIFFVDDQQTSGKEQGPGSLRWLTLYGPPRR